MNKLAPRLALLAASTVFFLLLAEGGVRLMPYLPLNAMGLVMQADPILDHSLRPNARGRMKSYEYNVPYLINSRGNRDDENVAAHSLMIIGDSFMEGYGVNRGELLADRLEAMGIPTINAAVKSYSPLLEYLYLRHSGLSLHPDTVILFFDLSDPSNDEYYSRRLITDDSGLPLSIRPRRITFFNPTGPIAEWLSAHSALYAYLHHVALKYFPENHEDVGYAGTALDLDPLFPGRDSIPDTDYIPRWNKSFTYLKLIRDTLKPRNIDFKIVVYPYGHQVSPDAWSEGRKGHNFPSGISSRRPERVLLNWAASESIPVISLYDTFLAHPRPASLYFITDGHWTAAGHDLAARAVYDALKR